MRKSITSRTRNTVVLSAACSSWRTAKLLALIERYQAMHDFAAYIPISALKGDGVDLLRKEILARLPEGPALYPKDHLTDQP